MTAACVSAAPPAPATASGGFLRVTVAPGQAISTAAATAANAWALNGVPLLVRPASRAAELLSDVVYSTRVVPDGAADPLLNTASNIVKAGFAIYVPASEGPRVLATFHYQFQSSLAAYPSNSIVQRRVAVTASAASTTWVADMT